MHIAHRAYLKSRRLVDRWLATPAALRHLQASPDPRLAALGRALGDTLTERLTAEEVERLAPVRALRERLEQRPDDLDGQSIGRVAQADSRGHRSLLMLFRLVREFRPLHCLELGTCIGLSAAYTASALDLNGKGELVTMEYSPARVALARRNLEELGLRNVRVEEGRFADILTPYLATAPAIDFAFIDGHHDEQATLQYLELLLPHLAADAVLVFDDISWSAGMARAWQRIQAHSRLGISIDLYAVGIGIAGPEASPRTHRLSLG
jgi:predicted O-methyltransferase YrrM